MELERLAQALGSVEVVNPASADVRELAYDARRVEAGTLFFCVRGAQADGHDFAAEAVASGAAALVVERPLDLPVPQLVVADARAAMPRAAVAFFGDPTSELAVAGVTGTIVPAAADAVRSATARRYAPVVKSLRLLPGIRRVAGFQAASVSDRSRE